MIQCTITSPKGTRQYKGLKKVTLPAFSGKMQVLPGHVESFLLLKKGDVVLNKGQDIKEKIAITNGECHIKNDNITIIL